MGVVMHAFFLLLLTLVGFMNFAHARGFHHHPVPIGPVVTPPSTIQVPGPSAALYANPYYTCVRNFYISNAGSSGGNGSLGSPWNTIAQADTSARTGGDCINIAPGTYASAAGSGSNTQQGTNGGPLLHGGTTASSTGYVVYRCGTGPTDFAHMDQCVFTDQGGFAVGNGTGVPAYFIFDGLSLSANPAAGSLSQDANAQGFQVYNGDSTLTAHHVWVTNSVITGFGQSGIQLNDGEYFYAVHNKIFTNSNQPNCNGGSRGSGISYAWGIPIAAYSPTADDQNNKVTGNTGLAFRDFIMWNDIHGNFVDGSGGCAGTSEDTDGNGIILDTMDHESGNNHAGGQYEGGVLISSNVVYSNGGAGVQMFGAMSGVLAVNNTCYNNYIDPGNIGTARGCINDQFAFAITAVNNLSYAPCGSGNLTNNSAYLPNGSGFTATTTLNGTITSGASSLILASNSSFPGGATGPPININNYYIFPGGNVIQIGSELLRVTSGWGTNTLTVTRAFGGTTAASHTSGATITWVAVWYQNNFGFTSGGGSCSVAGGGDVSFPPSQNTTANPTWVSVGGTNVGTMTNPGGATHASMIITSPANFALQGTSSAIGAGLLTAPYNFLPAQNIDIGACHHSLTVCP